jgi:hypothetical protein
MNKYLIKVSFSIMAVAFISCSSITKELEIKVIDTRLHKIYTNKESITGFIFVFCNNDSLFNYIIAHQYDDKGIKLTGKINDFCILNKSIEPHISNKELFLISFQFCMKNFEKFDRAQLDSISNIIYKDIEVKLEFSNGNPIKIDNDHNQINSFLEVKYFNPNDWFNTSLIDTLKSPPPPAFKIMY